MHVDRLKTLPISQNPEREHVYVIFVCYILSHSCHSVRSEQYHSAFCLMVSQPSHFTDPIVLEMAPLPLPFLIGHNVLQPTYITKHILALISSEPIWTQFLQR